MEKQHLIAIKKPEIFNKDVGLEKRKNKKISNLINVIHAFETQIHGILTKEGVRRGVKNSCNMESFTGPLEVNIRYSYSKNDLKRS